MWQAHRLRALSSVLRPQVLLWIMVAASSLLGLTPFNHYGESWDEQVDFQYGEDAWKHYGESPGYWEAYWYIKHYGPAYLMLANSIASHIKPLLPAWHITDARHFVNHLTFQVATLALFYLCLRYMGGWSALVAALLFATQPVLFGHSFINQKDTPFMAGFVLAAWLGFMLADKRPLENWNTWKALRQEWRMAPRRRKVMLIVSGIAAILVWLELVAVKGVVLPSVVKIVGDAHGGVSLPWVNEWFTRVAERASLLPVEAYQSKATALYLRWRWPVCIAALAPFAVLGVRTFTSALSSWWNSEGSMFSFTILAGAATGLATASARVIGFSLVSLVGFVLIVRRRWRGVPPLIAYAAAAAATCVAAWPYLHASPLRRLWKTILVKSDFPWGGGILYTGHIYHPDTLPWHYIPVLLAIQLTLPAVLLAAAGIPLALSRILKHKERMAEYLALLAWAFGPVAAALVLNSTVYNNFRQFLFITPPLFVFAGATFQAVADRLRSRLVAAMLALVVLAPGIAGFLRLHPYEYVYYNALVGGVRGAYRSYELDYWCTSYREAMQWINEAAPPDALIAVAPPDHIPPHFARPDLRFVYAQHPQDLHGEQPLYGLGCGRGNNDLGFFPEYAVAHEVAVEGARLSVIRDFRLPAEAAHE